MSTVYLHPLTNELFSKILQGWKWSDFNDQIMSSTSYLGTFDYSISAVRKCGLGEALFRTGITKDSHLPVEHVRKERKRWIWAQRCSPLVQNKAQQKALSCLTGFSEKSEMGEKWSLNSAHQQALGYFTLEQPRKSISPSSPFKKPHKGRYNQAWIAAQNFFAACF